MAVDAGIIAAVAPEPMTRYCHPSKSAPQLVARRMRTSLRHSRVCAWLILAFAVPARVWAQGQTGTYASSSGPRISFGAEASVAVGSEDYGYFNNSTDAYSVLRLLRVDGSAALRLTTWLTFVGDVRVQGDLWEGGWQILPYAAFARFRPSSHTPFDIQMGIVPPVFGAFSRRAYGVDNPLIGFPLGYQYLTTLRADALPASADELLSKRGRGWRVRYSVGNPSPDHGEPLANGMRYPVGFEVHAGGGRVEAGVAVTTGSLSMPDAHDVGWNQQVSGRLAVRPIPGLVFGGSVSHGAFLERSLTDTIGTTGNSGANDQTALGFDAEFSRGHWIIRAEGIYSRWRFDASAPPYIANPLGAFAFDVEGRYRILPGLYAAVRLDRLGFTEICGSTECLPWDAPVRRVEAGGGYSLRRNMVVKGVYQYNWRDGSFRPREGLASAQLLVWF